MRDGGSVAGVIDGGVNDNSDIFDVLVGPDASNTWTLTGANAGTLNSTTAFTGIERLTGGSKADLFRVQTSGSLSGVLDGGLDAETFEGSGVASADTLDFSLRGSAVSVDLALANATGVDEFARIDVVIGSGVSGDTLSGPDGAGIIDISESPLDSLVPGINVRIADGTIYEYVGPALTDSDSGTAGEQPFDLTMQDYLDEDLWTESNDHITWTVTGVNAGEVEGTVFSDFETCRGAARRTTTSCLNSSAA